MGMKTATRHLAAWIASIAILFAALAPSVSHAMSTSSNGIWAEICSIAGTKYVKVDSDQGSKADLSSASAIHLKHCPFCATHAGSFALPPDAAQMPPLLSLQDTRPLLFFQAPYPLPAWTTAPSRAPPAFI